MTPLVMLFFVSFVPVGMAVILFVVARWWRDRDGRRSPLSERLFHGPGEQLRQRIAEHDEEIVSALLMIFMIGPLMLAIWALSHVNWQITRAMLWSVFPPIVITLSFTLWFALRVMRHSSARRSAREGLASELMTAQQLIPLMGSGCLVFHDIPAKGFNLDHVVIGPHAVYLIETKSRKKPKEQGKDSARVTFDGERLHFPDHTDSNPIKQVRSEAQWLHDHLRSAAGEAVRIVPVVALPGWFVVNGKDAHRADVAVINPKMHSIFFEKRYGPEISESLRTRIAHALILCYPEAA